MTFNALIRGFTPRPWKSKQGKQYFSGTFVVLDLTPDRPIMDTVKLDKDFADEAALARAATFVGKNAVVVVQGLRTGMDGTPHFVGEVEAVSK